MVDFIDPPEKKSKESSEHWRNVVRQLRDNPGTWGFVGNYSIGVATHIRKGRYPAFLSGTHEDRQVDVLSNFEITTRTTEDGRNDIYIRYVGVNGPKEG